MNISISHHFQRFSGSISAPVLATPEEKGALVLGRASWAPILCHAWIPAGQGWDSPLGRWGNRNLSKRLVGPQRCAWIRCSHRG